MTGPSAEEPETFASSSLLDRLSDLYGIFLVGLALLGAYILFVMMIIISADLILRNIPLIPGMRGIKWVNDVSELMLFLLTMLAAPWLLRKGQHIRVDVILVMLPKKVGWYLEWACDVIALICCAMMTWLGLKATVASFSAGALSVKTIVLPEWWLQVALPFCFALLTIEMLFRMRRLYFGERAPRSDAVSAS